MQAEFLVKEIADLVAGSTAEVAVYLTAEALDRLDVTAWAQAEADPTEQIHFLATRQARLHPPFNIRPLLPYALTTAAVIGVALLPYAIRRVRNWPQS